MRFRSHLYAAVRCGGRILWTLRFGEVLLNVRRSASVESCEWESIFFSCGSVSSCSILTKVRLGTVFKRTKILRCSLVPIAAPNRTEPTWETVQWRPDRQNISQATENHFFLVLPLILARKTRKMENTRIRYILWCPKQGFLWEWCNCAIHHTLKGVADQLI